MIITHKMFHVLITLIILYFLLIHYFINKRDINQLDATLYIKLRVFFSGNVAFPYQILCTIIKPVFIYCFWGKALRPPGVLHFEKRCCH